MTTTVAGAVGVAHGDPSTMLAMADIFAALGDPTRTTLLSQLVAEGRGTATSLTTVTDISRQAVDRHLRVLADAGLVESRREGREVVYALKPRTLAWSAEWLARLGRNWENRLLTVKAAAEAGGDSGQGSG